MRVKFERSVPALVGFVIAGLLSLWLQNQIIPYTTPYWGIFGNGLDLDVYRGGAQVVLDGERLYDAKLLGQMDFTYAPISIGLFIPMALMSVPVAHAVWTIGIFVALYFVIVLGFRSLGHDVTWKLRLIAVSMVAISMLLEPVRSTIWFGQINVFLMLLICADLLRPDGSRLKGIGGGIAAGIKLTPMLFAVYYVALRQWRTATTICLTAAASVAIGFVLMPSASWQFWTSTLFDSNRVSSPQTVGNQSIRGALANVIGTDDPNTIAWALLSLAMLALTFGAAIMAHRRGQELLALSLVGMASCAVSPVAWGHHWVWIVPLLVVAIHHIVEAGPTWRRWTVGLFGAGAFAVMIAWRTHLAFPIWYTNRSVDEAYLTGIFFKDSSQVLSGFTTQGYCLMLVVVAALVIVLCRTVPVRSGAAETIVGGRR